MHPNRISILGVGLLGGSVGLAAKAFLSGCQVVGYGHRPSTLQQAMEIGAIDHAESDIVSAVKGSGLVILCTPVGLFPEMLQRIAGHLDPGTIVTDVGSTKRSVVRTADRLLPKGVHFVGSHPMAGSEKRGVEYARPDLFQNAVCILTPAPATDKKALAVVDRFWRGLGMSLVHLAPQEHDRLLADVSHLPHAVAAALISMQLDEGLPLAGKGFLDTTRIAGGDGALWRDIFLDNRDNLKASLSRLRKQLEALESLLESEDGEALTQWLNRAAARRHVLLREKLREVTPD